MEIVHTLDALAVGRPARIAIGAFDGVHVGHQALIGGMVRRAQTAGQAALAITFDPHPSVFLRGRRPSFYLSTQTDKARWIAALGVDALVIQRFDAAFAAITAAAYIDQLVRHGQVQEITCGPDFALGHGREGTVAYLEAAGRRLGFGVHVEPPVQMDGEVVSSTRIRQCLRDGAVDQAARYLGRPFTLRGEVVTGQQRGRTLGIPTANLAVPEEVATPAVGVYACQAETAAGQHAQAVVNIGFRPTFNGGEPRPTIEAHLLDFNQDLYGQPLRLNFIARLRGERKFANVEALVAQIRHDIEAARQLVG